MHDDLLRYGVPIPRPLKLQGATKKDLEKWSSQQVVAFLDKLGEYRSMTAMHKSMTRKMNDLYSLDDSHNAEIRCSWYLLCIKVKEVLTLPCG